MFVGESNLGSSFIEVRQSDKREVNECEDKWFMVFLRMEVEVT